MQRDILDMVSRLVALLGASQQSGEDNGEVRTVIKKCAGKLEKSRSSLRWEFWSLYLNTSSGTLYLEAGGGEYSSLNPVPLDLPFHKEWSYDRKEGNGPDEIYTLHLKDHDPIRFKTCYGFPFMKRDGSIVNGFEVKNVNSEGRCFHFVRPTFEQVKLFFKAMKQYCVNYEVENYEEKESSLEITLKCNGLVKVVVASDMTVKAYDDFSNKFQNYEEWRPSTSTPSVIDSIKRMIHVVDMHTGGKTVGRLTTMGWFRDNLGPESVLDE